MSTIEIVIEKLNDAKQDLSKLADNHYNLELRKKYALAAEIMRQIEQEVWQRQF